MQRFKSLPLFLTVLSLFFSPALYCQWLETTIYIPDSLSGILFPRAFTYNATNNKIYVGGAYGDCVIVIDGATNQKIAKIPAGSYITALCWNQTDNKVYCANEDSDDVTIIDGANNQVLATVTVGRDPLALCWNSIQNRVYVANYSGSSVSVIRDVTTGIEENETTASLASNDFIIYPTPTKNLLCVRGPLTGRTVKIFDVSGKLIKEVAITTSQSHSARELKIPLKGMKPGTYFLRLDETTKKFILR